MFKRYVKGTKCLACKQKWLRGRLHNWAHCFGIIDWFTTGDFRMDVVDIHKGKTFVWGQEVNGNE